MKHPCLALGIFVLSVGTANIASAESCDYVSGNGALCVRFLGNVQERSRNIWTFRWQNTCNFPVGIRYRTLRSDGGRLIADRRGVFQDQCYDDCGGVYSWTAGCDQ